MEQTRDWDGYYRSGADFAALPVWAVDRMMVAHRRSGAPATMLEVGCGTGKLAAAFAAEGFAAMGIDTSRAAIERARVEHPSVEFAVGGIDSVRRHFGVIAAKHMVAYVPDQGEFFDAVAERLEDNGLFFVVTPTSDQLHMPPRITVDRAAFRAALEERFEITSSIELKSGVCIIAQTRQ